MATTRKIGKKAPSKGASKKKDDVRTSKHGNTTYRSYPQDNQSCPMRCSPPARNTNTDGTRKTTVKYRHRTLDITSSGRSAKPTTAKKTEGKKTAAKPKTVKAPTVKKTASKVKAPAKPKTVKTPARTTAKKTAIPAMKVTPLGRYIDGIILGVPQPIPTAVRSILPTDSVFEWYVRTWPDDDLALDIDHRLKFAQVKKAMGTKAIYKVIGVGDSIVRERIETGIREFYRDGVPINPALAPMAAKKTTSKTVKAPVRTADDLKPLSKQDAKMIEDMIKSKGKEMMKKTPAKTPAKAPAKAPTPPAARGISGKFDAGKLKAIAQFLHRLDKSLDMPIFSNDQQFVDQNKIMAVRLVSRMPGKSFVGLPLEPSLKDLAVPMDSLIKRLDKEVIDVAYRDGRLYYNWNSPGLSVSTAVHESNNTQINRFTFTRSSVQGDTKFRTTQSRFQDDVKKAVQSIGGKLPTRYDSYKDTALAMCSPKGTVSYTDKIPEKCAGYSAYFLNIIAGFVAKAKGQQCIVMFKPNYPLRVVCDFGPYMTEIMLAPIVNPEY